MLSWVLASGCSHTPGHREEMAKVQGPPRLLPAGAEETEAGLQTSLQHQAWRGGAGHKLSTL